MNKKIKNSFKTLKSEILQLNLNTRTTMAISYISDIIEEYAHKIFKSNEKNLYKVVGKNNGWNEMTKIIDFSKLR